MPKSLAINKRVSNVINSYPSYQSTRLPGSQNWFFTMTSVYSTGYPQKIFHTLSVTFIEWYVIPHDDGITFDIHGYFQLEAPKTASSLVKYFTETTTLKPTTIREKAYSQFDSIPDKPFFGEEKAFDKFKQSLNIPYTSILYFPRPTRVPLPVPTNQSCWLPQVPPVDPCLNRKKIISINHDED